MAGGRGIRRCSRGKSFPSALYFSSVGPQRQTNRCLVQPFYIRNCRGGAGMWQAGASFAGLPGVPVDKVGPSASGTVPLDRLLAALI